MRILTRIGAVAFVLAMMRAQGVEAQSPTGIVSGTVSLPEPDGQVVGVPGVTLTLTCAGVEPRVDLSSDTGQFRFADVPAGACSIIAELQGFKSAAKTVAVKAGATADVALQLDLDTLHVEVNVVGNEDPDTVGGAPIAARVERITASMMQNAPIASERFQDALPLIPSVVRGPDGLLNISGTRSNQSALMFNNADGTDPVTGEDAIELPIDAVSVVQVRGAAFAPEFGLSAGAVTTVETQRAGDAWHITLNDLEPRLRRRAGEFRGIESWTPRFAFGGPLVKGKLNFLESVQYEYSQTRVFGLPAFESDTKLQSFESFSRVDWTVTATNHFTGSAMVSPRKTTYAGLNTFNPQGVTPDIRNHNVLASASDQVVVGDGVLDTRVSVKQFDSNIYPSQGGRPMVLAPEVNSGSYFNDQDRTSRRVEWLTTYALTPLGSAHLVKVGAGVTYERFDGINRSRRVDIVREDGTLSQAITFTGDGLLNRHRTALRGYGQDSWAVSSRLSVLLGARYDYDTITGDVNIAPRGSFTATVSDDGRTVIRGGAGLFYDPIPLNVAAFDQMQERTIMSFQADGVTPVGPMTLMPNVVASAIHTPRSVNWNVEADREWIKNFFVRVGYQQRDQRFEPILNPITSSIGAASQLLLATDGRSRYREGQVTARYRFHGTDQIVASYTRSSAVGNLNDFNSYFGNIENPVIRSDARGPLPWDSPNRYLLWSSVSLPRGVTVFPLLDLRSGFPLSVVDEDRNFVGRRNQAGRFPTFASLDLQVSKRIRVFHHNATVGLKVFNITNHFNPRDYQGNLASANFGGFANGVGRTFRGKWVFEF